MPLPRSVSIRDDFKTAGLLAAVFAVLAAVNVPVMLKFLPPEAQTLPLPVAVFSLILGLQCLVVYGLLGKGDGSFSPFTSYPADPGVNSPDSVSLVDVNGDGHLDVVTTDGANARVLVFLGDGQGALAPFKAYDAGTGPVSLAVADLNEDGHPDLVTMNGGKNRLTVLLNTGNGTFPAPTNYSVGNSPAAVAVGDVNRDGSLDVVAANQGESSVSVLLNQKDGTFAPKVDLPVGNNPTSVALGDVNGDGFTDIVTANAGNGTVSVLLGGQGGTFAPKMDFPVGPGPVFVTLGDLNGDGRLDIVVTRQRLRFTQQFVTVLLNKGDGTFAAPVDYLLGDPNQAIAIGSVAVGDVNGDGHLDLVVATDLAGPMGSIDVLLGKGDGTFGPATSYPVAGGTDWVTLGDLDRDGHLDIVAAGGKAGVTVLLGKGDGTFGAKTEFAIGGGVSTSVALADLNGDSFLDVLTVNTDPGNGLGLDTAVVLLGNGNGTFQPKSDYSVGSHPNAIAVGDLNGDGLLDFVTANGNGTVSPRFHRSAEIKAKDMLFSALGGGGP